MVDNMRGRGIATCTAEPFVASQAFDYTALVVDATISKERELAVSKDCTYFPSLKKARFQILTRMHVGATLFPPLWPLDSLGSLQPVRLLYSQHRRRQHPILRRHHHVVAGDG